MFIGIISLILYFRVVHREKSQDLKYFPLFPSKSCNTCIMFHVGYYLNVELMKHSTYGGGRVVESGRAGSDFLSAIAGQRFAWSGRAGSDESYPWTTLIVT